MKIIIAALIICAAAVTMSFAKSGHFFKSLFTSAFQGIISLIAVNVTGLATGVCLSLNWYTIAGVSVFGLPGTIALVIMKSLFK